MSATSTLPEVEEDITEFDGFAHYVRVKSLLAGGAVVALCGKKYVPIIIAGAEKLPICKKCDDLMEMLHLLDGV